MANNCLLTKLKSVVDNDNLSKLGVLTVTVSTKTITNTDQQKLVINPVVGKTLSIKVIGDGAVSYTLEGLQDNIKEIPAHSSGTLYFSNGDYKVEVSSKYDISVVHNSVASGCICSIENIDDLRYSPIVLCLLSGSDKTSGNISNFLKIPSLGQIRFSDTSVYGNITNGTYTSFEFVGTNIGGNLSEFAPNRTSASLQISRTQVVGDISSVSECTQLLNILIEDTSISGNIETLYQLTKLVQLNVNHTNVSGNVDVLANAMKSGRNDGDTLRISCSRANITYDVDNKPIPVQAIITFNSSLEKGYSLAIS